MMPCILGEKRAQATVEMAVVAPVMIILALIVYNLMQFACAVARFDRVAPDIVLAQGVSPQGDATLGKTATVESALQEAMSPYTVRVAVASEADEASGTELLSLVAAPQRYHRRSALYRSRQFYLRSRRHCAGAAAVTAGAAHRGLLP